MLGFTRAPIPGSGQHYEFVGGPAPAPLQTKRPSLSQGQGHGQRGTGNQPIQGQPTVTSSLKYGQPPLGDPPLQARPSAPDPSMHPQFSHFAAVNEPPPHPGPYQAGPDALGHGSDQKGKKRGRPSKAEYEIRAAQAIARGEPWPPIKKAKNPRTSVEGVAGSSEGADSPNLTKKVARKPKAKVSPGTTLGEGQAPATQVTRTVYAEDLRSPEDEIRGPDRMQIDPVEGQMKSTIPETQASKFPTADSLLAGMQEQAKQGAQAAKAGEDTHISKPEPTQTETVQSSITIHQEATPQKEQPISTTS